MNDTDTPVAPSGWAERLTGTAFRYHHWFGLVCCIAVMSWGASGVMHPIMSRLNPQPVNMRPPVMQIALHDALPPAEVLARAGIDEIAGLRVIFWNSKTFYQASLPEDLQRRYFDANTGNETQGADVLYATALAKHFTGNDSKAAPTLLELFDDDYLSVNRLLPVWRIDVAGKDNLRAYIETSPPRLAALVDDSKATLGNLFRLLHTWGFVGTDGARNTLRKSLITLLLLSVLLSASSGILIYGFLWKRGSLGKRHRPLRRWHRTLGIVVSVSALTFAGSGLWHLLGGESRETPPPHMGRLQVSQLQLPDTVRHGAWQEAVAVNLDGQVYYQLRAASPAKLLQAGQSRAEDAVGEHDHRPKAGSQNDAQTHYLRSDNGLPLANAEALHARWLAQQYSGLPDSDIAGTSLITRFEGEYGFLNKRLPVWRVDYATPDHTAYYVETGSGALATVVKDGDRWEGWSFAYLHKFHWLDFAGNDVRDFIMALFGLGNLTVSVLGLWMFVSRYRA